MQQPSSIGSINFQLWVVVFLNFWYPLRHRIIQYLNSKLLVVVNEPRGLSNGITLNIWQDVLKSANLLHRWKFNDSQTYNIVKLRAVLTFIFMTANFNQRSWNSLINFFLITNGASLVKSRHVLDCSKWVQENNQTKG